ncbi:hypothetical protein GH721_10405 [Kriegella sp. EG-1]|nr:hypothetical protein [Flavobacteriaceae bacterium EG-1]
MKIISKISILSLVLLFLIACSAEDTLKEESQSNNSDILTENSPWRFSNFKLDWSKKTEKDTITDEEIELDVIESYKGLMFSFNSDGTGQTVMQDSNDEPHTWTWFFDGNDEICFDGICETNRFTNIVLSTDNFSFNIIAGSPSISSGEQIIYSGRYTFN